MSLQQLLSCYFGDKYTIFFVLLNKYFAFYQHLFQSSKLLKKLQKKAPHN